MKPPDLQELVARHGTYDRIPAEEWRKYDAAMDLYKTRVRGPPPAKLPKENLKATGK